MGVMGEMMLLFAQAQNAAPTQTPDAVEITLVDEGKAWWKDYVVPAATLAAALIGGWGGVVIGGRMNCTTFRTLETERADREDKRDAAKASRELVAERRLAVGSLRLLIDRLQYAASLLDTESKTGGDDPLVAPTIDTALDVRSEDKHAIAMWVSDEIWSTTSKMLNVIALSNLNRVAKRATLDRGEEINAEAYRATARSEVRQIHKLIGTLTDQLRRLEQQDANQVLVTPRAAAAPP